MKKTIVDVRNTSEFASGKVPGSINIPLSEIPFRLDEIKKLPQPVVLCCASGYRSQQAMEFLKARGIACENGGSWLSLLNN